MSILLIRRIPCREWGLTYEDLAETNPRLIYASLTAYGEQGPERDREGFDLVAYWARSGLMDLPARRVQTLRLRCRVWVTIPRL